MKFKKWNKSVHVYQAHSIEKRDEGNALELWGRHGQSSH